MSLANSRVQNLPSVILRSIIGYAVSNLENEQADDVRITNICSILQCCQSWRAVCLGFFCSEVKVSITRQQDIACAFSQWPRQLPAPSFESVSSMVKDVNITIDSWHCVFEFLPKTKPAWLQLLNRRFFQAYSFRLNIYSSCADMSFSNAGFVEAIGNIDHLFDLFRQLVPYPKSIFVNVSSLYPSDQGLEIIKYIGQGLSDFAKDVPVVEIIDNVTSSTLPVMKFVGISPLSKFSLTALCIHDLTFELVRRNSPYLQSLHISLFKESNVMQLFYGENEVPVEYPCLDTLYLKPNYSRSVGDIKAPKEFVPFPVLKKLDIWKIYPFGDDLVFRGNSHLLEHLRLPIYPDFIAMSNECEIFTPRRFSRLSSLYISITLTFLPFSDKDNQDVVTHVYKIIDSTVPGRVCSFALRNWYWDVSILEGMPSYPLFTGITSLDLSETKVRFTDIVHLLQSCSSIRILSILPESGVVEIEGIQKTKQANHVIETCSGIGQFLETLNLVFQTKEDAINVATLVSLVALVCPRLTLVGAGIRMFQVLKTAFDELLLTRKFKKHSERLKNVKLYLKRIMN